MTTSRRGRRTQRCWFYLTSRLVGKTIVYAERMSQLMRYRQKALVNICAHCKTGVISRSRKSHTCEDCWLKKIGVTAINHVVLLPAAGDIAARSRLDDK